ncbi:hypothetical protein FACS189461_4520 [Spirochaetia bacterium]|nr:hypothetical protein FACS189461_4520 [Spirochaetia bacterium]
MIREGFAKAGIPLVDKDTEFMDYVEKGKQDFPGMYKGKK